MAIINLKTDHNLFERLNKIGIKTATGVVIKGLFEKIDETNSIRAKIIRYSEKELVPATVVLFHDLELPKEVKEEIMEAYDLLKEGIMKKKKTPIICFPLINDENSIWRGLTIIDDEEEIFQHILDSYCAGLILNLEKYGIENGLKKEIDIVLMELKNYEAMGFIKQKDFDSYRIVVMPGVFDFYNYKEGFGEEYIFYLPSRIEVKRKFGGEHYLSIKDGKVIPIKEKFSSQIINDKVISEIVRSYRKAKQEVSHLSKGFFGIIGKGKEDSSIKEYEIEYLIMFEEKDSGGKKDIIEKKGDEESREINGEIKESINREIENGEIKEGIREERGIKETEEKEEGIEENFEEEVKEDLIDDLAFLEEIEEMEREIKEKKGKKEVEEEREEEKGEEREKEREKEEDRESEESGGGEREREEVEEGILKERGETIKEEMSESSVSGERVESIETLKEEVIEGKEREKIEEEKIEEENVDLEEAYKSLKISAGQLINYCYLTMQIWIKQNYPWISIPEDLDELNRIVKPEIMKKVLFIIGIKRKFEKGILIELKDIIRAIHIIDELYSLKKS